MISEAVIEQFRELAFYEKLQFFTDFICLVCEMSSKCGGERERDYKDRTCNTHILLNALLDDIKEFIPT